MDLRQQLVKGARLAGAALLAWCGSAHAFYVSPTTPPTWSGVGVPYYYGGGSAAGAQWNLERAMVTLRTNLGGRAVDLPGMMRLNSNAGRVMARAALATPWGRSASFIAWAGLALWTWNEAMQRWEVPDVQGSVNERLYVWAYGGYSATLSVQFNSVSAAANYGIQWRKQNGLCGSNCTETYVGPGDCASVPAGQGTLNCTAEVTRTENGNQVEFGGLTMRGTANPNPDPLNYKPATDFDADKLANDHPWQDAAPNAPNEAQKHVPLPQDAPVLLPSAQEINGEPQTQKTRYPLGEPYYDPVAQKWRQPVADVKGVPTGPEPWRADVQPQEVETDEDGIDQPTPVDQNSPPGTPTGTAPEQTDCDKYPNASACKPLGSAPPEPPLVTKVVPLSITPLSGFGPSTASCPADRTAVVHGMSLAMSWQPFCQFANGIRPVVIAVAWISAILAFMGLGRKGE